MVIRVTKSEDGLTTLMRRIGYAPDRRQPSTGEQSFSRPLRGAPYPKFHVYTEEGGQDWVLKLHLDQNKPKYEGTAAHGGEYDGPLVEAEAERIKSTI